MVKFSKVILIFLIAGCVHVDMLFDKIVRSVTNIGECYDMAFGITSGNVKGDTTQYVYVGDESGYLYEFKWDGKKWKKSVLMCAEGGIVELKIFSLRNKACLYAGSYDGNVYEFEWDNGWKKSIVLSTYGVIWGLEIGDARGDGKMRLYAISSEGIIYEIEWNGAYWQADTVGTQFYPIWGLTLGDARGDGKSRLYTVNSMGEIYEYEWNGTEWIGNEIGYVAWDGERICIADRGDGKPRIYVAGYYGLYEFEWNTTGWSKTYIKKISDANDVIAMNIGGENALLVSDSQGLLHLLKYDGEWNVEDIEISDRSVKRLTATGQKIFASCFDHCVYEIIFKDIHQEIEVAGK